MASKVPGMKQDALPAELGGKPEQRVVQVNPAEHVVYEPVGLMAARKADGNWRLQFLISPFKMVSIDLLDEEKVGLVQQLTGGIVVPS